MAIPVVNLRPGIEATRADWQARLDALIERNYFILGPDGAAFETEFAAAMGGRFAVGVANGTAAIELCLRDAGVTGEVLTTALTAPFSGIGILAAGAKVRFADVDPQTLSMDPGDAGNRVRKATAALMPVHLYGQPAPIDAFARLAQARRLPLIQDAAQAHGATYHGRPLTDFSPYIAYSFYPTKNLGCLGDGGAIVTSRAAIDKRLRRWRDGGRKGGQVSYFAGINSRLDEMQVCYLRAFLPKLAEWNSWRGRIARIYDQALRGCPGVTLVKRWPCSVNHLYVVRAARRDKLREYLGKRGIGTGVHYPVPLHLHPAFAMAKQKRGDLPHAERACREILSLPLWPYLSDSDALAVAEGVRSFYAG